MKENIKYPFGREEEIKNRVAVDIFKGYDCSKIIGNIDFCVSNPRKGGEDLHFLWAEAKKGDYDIIAAITQLVLTIGKARTFDKHMPPHFLGAFDGKKIAFVPYNSVQDVFYTNDFNWNVTPSDSTTKEFKLVYDLVKKITEDNVLIFDFNKDIKELKTFIKDNFVIDNSNVSKVKIDKNNFIIVYNKWVKEVKPTIGVNWEVAKKNGIIDGDFYLADLLSVDNKTIKEKLYVLLKENHYELDRVLDDNGMFISKRTEFNDGQKAHKKFWSKYERPPKEDYWNYIVERRDLLVPQDVRERKGSFFTPAIWVEKSQEYIARILGENWQDEYYVWDCAAGTGNLLFGLVNKYNIFASTLDKQDIDVMKDRAGNGFNMLPEHIFQFDFLNDEIKPKSAGGKVPDALYDIITDADKRKKLLIYINPPYANVGSIKRVKGEGKHKKGLYDNISIYSRYKDKIGISALEIFVLFMCRIKDEIQGSKLGLFSKTMFMISPSYKSFREHFYGKFLGGFICPSYTFDNVSGDFPISFTMWDLSIKCSNKDIPLDVYDDNGLLIGKRTMVEVDKTLNDYFLPLLNSSKGERVIGRILTNCTYRYQSHIIHISVGKTGKHITSDNLIYALLYFSINRCSDPEWTNSDEIISAPYDDSWTLDKEFISDCVMFSMFHRGNRISSKDRPNDWIPFTEAQVNARSKFKSRFMSEFLSGKVKINNDLFKDGNQFSILDNMSNEAKEVYDAGLELWKYYHSQPHNNVDASLYDIKEYFCGRDSKGWLNRKSNDEHFNTLIDTLRKKVKALAKNIESKAIRYGFLR